MCEQNIHNEILQFFPEMAAIRQQLHNNPELGFQEQATSRLVAEKLESWGYEVTTGLAGTGVVGTLRCGNGTHSIGIRADMDALPIQEENDLAYKSSNHGVMHACGHDGHTATLLAAARCLAERRAFSGVVHVIFQPAEEGLGGGRRMVEEGLFDRFPCDAVFGFHNVPGIPLGKFCFIPGPATAASDRARIIVRGKSGHGAQPQSAVDPIAAGAAIVGALQTVVSRNVDPLDAAVVTVSCFHAGEAYNIIPEEAELRLTIRSYTPAVRDLLEKRIKTIVHHQAEMFGAKAEVEYWRIHPASQNDVYFTAFARNVAEKTFGTNAVLSSDRPFTFSDDFAFMLEKCPGSYLFIGNGNSAGLHNNRYDFNDQLIETGATFWAELVETFLMIGLLQSAQRSGHS